MMDYNQGKVFFMLHKTTRRAVAALLTLVLIVSLIPMTPFTASGGSGEARGWAYIDIFDGVSLTGNAALEMIGDMDELILCLESGEPYVSYNSPPVYYAPPDLTVVDMADYDILNFAGRGGNFDVDSNGVATISSAYQVAEYLMYRIMSGDGYTMASYNGWTGNYHITFKPDGDLPYGKDRDASAYANKLLLEIARFVSAYFPHHFYFGCSYKSRDGGTYFDSFTIVLAHSSQTEEKHWEDEYEKAAALILSEDLDAGVSEQTLKNVHDYLAANVMYDLNAKFNQEAYSAFFNQSGKDYPATVCNGYALATSMLCLRMGLDVPYMNGDILGRGGGAHAWNLNLMDYPDNIRMVDTTWGRIQDPPASPGAFKGIRSDYFNKPLDDFRGDRAWSKFYESYIAYVHGDMDDLHDGMIFNPESGIDYANSKQELIATATSIATTTSVSPVSADDFKINLTTEKFIKPAGYSVLSYSIDGGQNWKAAPADMFTSDVKFQKLFGKDMTLCVADKALDSGTKKPSAGAVIVEFPKINKRPKTPALMVNYAATEAYAAAGEWLLTTKPAKGKAAEIKRDVDLAIADATKKKPDVRGWGAFKDGGGIPVKKMSGTKPEKTVYFFRSAPAPETDGSYTPASKMKKLSVSGQQKAPNYTVKNDKISVKAGTKSQLNGVVTTHAAKGDITAKGTYKLWIPATAKKPATEAKTLTLK